MSLLYRVLNWMSGKEHTTSDIEHLLDLVQSLSKKFVMLTDNVNSLANIVKNLSEENDELFKSCNTALEWILEVGPVINYMIEHGTYDSSMKETLKEAPIRQLKLVIDNAAKTKKKVD